MKGSIIDIFDDANLSIYSMLEKEYEIPNIMKTASESILNSSREDKKTFALNSIKRFPLDTPSDIIMSHLYLSKTASNLSQDLIDIATERITIASELMGVILPSKIKTASVEKNYVISTSDFAVSMPIKDLSDEFLEKNASFIYNDHFVLYPLNNEENIKKANSRFPQGLEEDFEPLRVEVAQKLASMIDENELSPKVKEYTRKFKASNVSAIVEKRASDYPRFSQEYLSIKDYILTDIEKFASELHSLDIESGASMRYDSGALPAYRYLQGIIDDTDHSKTLLKTASESFEFGKVQKYKSKLGSIYGSEVAHKAFSNPNNFNAFYSELDGLEQKAIERIFNGK